MDASHLDDLHPATHGRPRLSAATAAANTLCRALLGVSGCMALLLASALPPAHAQSGLPAGNAEQPIDLQAASSDFDYRNNSLLFKRVTITQGALQVTAQQASATGLDFDNSEWLLQGDVQIVVPGGKLNSSEARVKFRNNEIVLATIKGSPAKFEQRLKEQNQVARGRAGSIVYDVKASTVRLTGAAWLSDGQNEIRGNTLIYDIGRERVQANPDEKDPGGVQITIKPRPRATATTPEAPPETTPEAVPETMPDAMPETTPATPGQEPGA